MRSGLLGVPYLAYAALCATLAAVWVFIWPVDQAADRAGLAFLIIRWGHCASWGCLAGACLAWARGQDAAGRALALAALACYGAFVVTAFVLR
jgi:hypothetical protein